MPTQERNVSHDSSSKKKLRTKPKEPRSGMMNQYIHTTAAIVTENLLFGEEGRSSKSKYQHQVAGAIAEFEKLYEGKR
ncbi:uncharacterized protein PAC_11190 [Phialocephala subalpina]|uniref:Uncharacterized protein n=1 Tax=Phialocephala subalpina TaxID=576137 RepID=A0A1L7X8E5_9HELO|nr:uncharacterized protein PAC_11190 [Phialocephala subalpina]